MNDNNIRTMRALKEAFLKTDRNLGARMIAVEVAMRKFGCVRAFAVKEVTTWANS